MVQERDQRSIGLCHKWTSLIRRDAAYEQLLMSKEQLKPDQVGGLGVSDSDMRSS